MKDKCASRQRGIRNLKRASVVLVTVIFVMGAQAQNKSSTGMYGSSPDPISLRGPNPADQFKEIRIEQRLENKIPLDLTFTDETGEKVQLGDYFNDKPVVLSLVYYECPMLCTQVLNGMVAAFDAADMKLNIGKDYEVVTVSIDPGETPEMAAAKKASYLEQYHKQGGDIGWHFLVGSEDSIDELATAVGYRYAYDELTDQYAHASGIVVLTQDGTISSYYLGIEYLPRNLQLAIMDAAEGNIGPLASQILLLCFQYDPTRGSYGFYVIRAVQLGGITVVLLIVAFWIVSYVHDKRKYGNQRHEDNTTS